MKCTWMFALILGVSLQAEARGARYSDSKVESRKPAASALRILPKLITFRQFQSLSPRQRAGYLAHVRQALVQLEHMQSNRLVAQRETAGLDWLKDLIVQFKFIEEAYAEPPSDMPVIVQSGGQWSYGCNKPGLVLDPVVNLCVTGSGGVPDSVRPSQGCSDGNVFAVYKGTSADGNNPLFGRCVPQGEFNQLSADTQSGLLRQNAGAGALDDGHGNPLPMVAKPKKFTSRAAAVLDAKALPLFTPSAVQTISSSGPAAPQSEANLPAPKLASLPVADAVKAAATLGNPPRTPVYPTIKNGNWVCTNDQYTFSQELGTCVVSLPGECASSAAGVTVTSASQTQYCVPSESFLALSTARQSQLCPSAPGKSSVSATAITCFANADLATIHDTSAASQDLVLGGTTPDQRKTLTSDTPAAPVVAPAQPVAAPQPAAGGCKWDDMTCQSPAPSSTKTGRLAFRKAYNNNFAAGQQNFKSTCLYSGNFSTYQNDNASSGQCQPVRSATIGGKTLKCTSYKQVLCNPIIFGMSADGKGICVNGASDSTEKCAAAVPPDKFKSADDAGGADDATWAKLKSDFEAAFKAYCMPNTAADDFVNAFQPYFCGECNKIGQELTAANQDYAAKWMCNGAPSDGGPAPAGADASSNQ